MANEPQSERKPMNRWSVALASFALGGAFSIIFAFIACNLGFLFSGLDFIFAVLIAGFFSGLLTAASTVFFKHSVQRYGWRLIFAVVSILALLLVSCWSYVQTHQALKTFMNPKPVPAGLHVLQGRGILFSGFVHFTASAADIAAIIKAKGLLAVPTANSEEKDITNIGAFEQSRISWGWWQPTNMSNPKFYFLHHKSDAIQGWSEGWWVNDKTNEVFAFVSG